VGSAIIATEPLGTERVARLLPGRRVYGDTRRVFSYFRPSPDGTRILFGGHCFEVHRADPSPFAGIYRSMLRTLPGLEGIRISHAWSGRIGVSRDHFPHIGNVEGVHYAMGYSGTGVTRSTYFGNKVALKLLGDPDGATEFDDIPFRSHGPPARMPFVVNAVVRWMTLLDRVDALRTSTGPS
jgi:glycine/D-amino acid oxidase-like deaminating enzyme